MVHFCTFLVKMAYFWSKKFKPHSYTESVDRDFLCTSFFRCVIAKIIFLEIMDSQNRSTFYDQQPPNSGQQQNVLEEPTGSTEFQKQGRHRDQRMRMQDQDLDADRMRDEGGYRYTDDADAEFISLNYPQEEPEGKPAPVETRYDRYYQK